MRTVDFINFIPSGHEGAGPAMMDRAKRLGLVREGLRMPRAVGQGPAASKDGPRPAARAPLLSESILFQDLMAARPGRGALVPRAVAGAPGPNLNLPVPTQSPSPSQVAGPGISPRFIQFLRVAGPPATRTE